MAKYVTFIASSIRGSIAGNTYTASPSSNHIVHAKRNHSVRQSNAQSLLQTCYSSARSVWNGMSDAQRDAWIDISNPRNPFTEFQSRYPVIDFYRRQYDIPITPALLPQPIDDSWAMLRFFAVNQTAGDGRVQFTINTNATEQAWGIIQLSKPLPLWVAPTARNFRLWQTISGIMLSSISTFFVTGDFSQLYLVRFRMLQYRFSGVQLLSRWYYTIAQPL